MVNLGLTWRLPPYISFRDNGLGHGFTPGGFVARSLSGNLGAGCEGSGGNNGDGLALS
jgi:hypothetical protein